MGYKFIFKPNLNKNYFEKSHLAMELPNDLMNGKLIWYHFHRFSERLTCVFNNKIIIIMCYDCFVLINKFSSRILTFFFYVFM